MYSTSQISGALSPSEDESTTQRTYDAIITWFLRQNDTETWFYVTETLFQWDNCVTRNWFGLYSQPEKHLAKTIWGL